MKKIEILYFEGCPNHKPAVELAREVVNELGIDAAILEVEIRGPEDALRLRFLGSPSILVNGVDVEPAARARSDFGYSCRTYDGEGLPARDFVRDALDDEGPATSDNVRLSGSVAHDCCSADRESAATPSDKGTVLSAGGAVLTAVVASACCWLPPTLLALGISAGSVGTFFAGFRPVFITLCVAFIGGAFFLAYNRKAREAAQCSVEDERRRKRGRRAAWAAAAMAVISLGYPRYQGVLAGAAPTDERAIATASVVDLNISGMTCEACATHIRDALTSVEGVNAASVSYASGAARVFVDPESMPLTQLLIDAVKTAGYSADPI